MSAVGTHRKAACLHGDVSSADGELGSGPTPSLGTAVRTVCVVKFFKREHFRKTTSSHFYVYCPLIGVHRSAMPEQVEMK